MARLLVTADYLHPGDAVDAYLRAHGHAPVHAPMTGRRGEDELAALLDGVEGALIANEPMTAAVLARATALRAVVRTGVGYDSVDVAAARRLGISVSNLPGINANAVAEFTIGLVLSASRHLVGLATGVAAGRWPRTDGRELRGSTLGLVGFGATARAVVPLARAFGMTVLCHTPRVPDDASGVEFVDFPALLARSDVVSLHAALNDATRGLIDARALAAMKPTALLVNTARGPLVDETALADAVRTGRIAGAALDVTAVEPLPADSVLRDVEGITVTSHMAGQTAQARAAAGREGAIELVAALAGEPAFRVG
ncbi:phosphoglycerate dehydrogenase [Cryptosporangium arvum]|uniref:Lactate dehydrogenase-like oxidoreductase n=1 Tax=Cryptosporangium arvum DSM 44712 TaxID=927661 RepID=A0A010ZT98_9ACTN|nr:phosphoglycerate dehydrogenase [Cryptosporangium arvum]EXG81929.1 lactate dehydrogenase-like oxidoreductase [Cryptosporangium arvum DSM 44712]